MCVVQKIPNTGKQSHLLRCRYLQQRLGVVGAVKNPYYNSKHEVVAWRECARARSGWVFCHERRRNAFLNAGRKKPKNIDFPRLTSQKLAVQPMFKF